MFTGIVSAVSKVVAADANRLGIDHAGIARAMGCRGTRVDDPAGLAPALLEALAARVPTVIDVMTSLSVSFADITSPLANEASPRRR